MKAGSRVLATAKHQRIKIERSRLLYNYSRYVYDHSVARFGRVDQKASGMLSTTVIVIGVVFGLGSEWIYTDLSCSMNFCFSVLSWVFASGMIISAAFSVWNGIATLRVSEIETPPLSNTVLDYMLYQSLIDSQAGAAATLIEANNSIIYQLNKKGRTLERAVIGTVSLISFSVAGFLSAMIRNVVI
ncbi:MULTISPECIES: hypothetical protein [Marispirochaeta]|uniref:hypothetical protein n=1 Tax=Marispirochaeta TaxID=1911565 RepID=UPI0029C69A12|nr:MULTISPECIES: hypothetical protein [Marispirochaeta]